VPQARLRRDGAGRAPGRAGRPSRRHVASVHPRLGRARAAGARLGQAQRSGAAVPDAFHIRCPAPAPGWAPWNGWAGRFMLHTTPKNTASCSVAMAPASCRRHASGVTGRGGRRPMLVAWAAALGRRCSQAWQGARGRDLRWVGALERVGWAIYGATHPQRHRDLPRRNAPASCRRHAVGVTGEARRPMTGLSKPVPRG
jgi:hypothetical protein